MANNFEKIFGELTNQYDPNTVFNEFLDYCIDINLFTTINQDLDFQGREKYYWEMFNEWIKITNDSLRNPSDNINSSKNGWYDYLGIFYENVVQTKYKAGARGQFFTPHDVCQLMTELIMDSKNDSNNFITDCCCGSGRFLLAGHSLMPNGIMIGSDLDEVACKMAVLNFYVAGARGSIIHQNTLTGEFFGAWRVNNYLGYGLPVPHIELVSQRDAYHFIGVENRPKEIVDMDSTVKVDEGIININKGTVQSKLI